MIGQGRGLNMQALKGTMNRLATATGGRAFTTAKADDLRQAFADHLDELSHQYLLGYAPTNTAHDGTLDLKVEVDSRHRIRTRDACGANRKNQ